MCLSRWQAWQGGRNLEMEYEDTGRVDTGCETGI